MWWVLSACGPATAPPTRAWLLSLHGEPVGLVRAWDTPDGAVRERLLRVEADGAVHERRTRVTVHRAPGGPVTAWTLYGDAGATSGGGPAWDPWVAPPPASGRVVLLDDAAGGAVERDVVRAEDTLRWDTPGGTVTVTLRDGVPSAGTWAGTTFAAVDPSTPPPAPLDVAAVLSRPAPRLARARGAAVGVWEVDGEEVRIDVPLAAELPAWTREVGALARAVAAEVPDAAAPFGGAGGGDCTEHAESFLRRAGERGWEARPVVGWWYRADPSPRLWLHAWAEVRVGDRWVGVDPTLGQFPADAAHLPVGRDTTDVARADGRSVTVRDLR